MRKHRHNWIIQAADTRYRDIDLTEWVMDIYVCECGAGRFIKTPKRLYDKGLKTLMTEKPRLCYNPNMFNGGLDFSPDSIAKEEAKFHFKNVGADKDGHLVMQKRPQTLNVISVKAPLRLWPRLIWAKIRRIFDNA